MNTYEEPFKTAIFKVRSGKIQASGEGNGDRGGLVRKNRVKRSSSWLTLEPSNFLSKIDIAISKSLTLMEQRITLT